MNDSMRGVVIEGPSGPVSPAIDREAWKAVRGPKIGSSDMPALLGIDEYVGAWEVWDRIVLGDWKDAEGADIRRGLKQEAVARDTFTERTGLQVQEVPMVHHPDDDRIVTDPDGLILRPNEWPEQILESEIWKAVTKLKGPGWLELKVPRIPTFYRYKEEGLPRRYIVQGQHHGLVTGLSWGFFAFYTPEYDDLIAFPVVEDPEFSAWMFSAARGWYDHHVTGRIRPDRPAPEPPRWPEPVPGEVTLRADPEWQEWADLLAIRFYERQEAVDAYDQTEAELLKLLDEEDQHIGGSGVTVKRKSTASQSRTDWKAVRAAVKLAQEDRDTDFLLAFDPDSDRFKYQTQSSEKVEVKVHAPNPMEIMQT